MLEIKIVDLQSGAFHLPGRTIIQEAVAEYSNVSIQLKYKVFRNGLIIAKSREVLRELLPQKNGQIILE